MGQRNVKEGGGEARPRGHTKNAGIAKSRSEEDNEVATKITTAKETHSLDLQSCNLRALPPQLFELEQLVTLNLANNLLKELDKSMTRLVSLNNLKLNGNKLGALPKLHRIKALEVLDVGKNTFADFPSSLCKCTSLVRLIAHCNRFPALPAEIGNLVSLTVLDLSTNNLPSLPSEIGLLTGLKTLDIDNNLLTELPAEFAHLSNITHLTCAHNRMQQFPEPICQLMFLQQLDLHGNEISTLPQDLSKLDSLKKLNLNGNTFTGFPEELIGVRGLIELDLSENKIETLSGAVSQLVELATLNLAKNKIASLPPEVGEMTVLMNLDLTNNKLKTLPTELGKLTYLSKLLVPGNKLKELPLELSTIAFLEEFDFSFNKIKEFPSELCKLDRLKHLKAASNRLSSLPENFGALFRLNELVIASNRLDELPESTSKLTRLQSLTAFGNRLTSLPSGLGTLKHLEILSLGDNLLDEAGLTPIFAEGADMPALEHLMISGNKLTTLPEGLCRFTTLRQLFASRNEISELPAAIGQLQKLNLLDLACNCITSIPEELATLALLKELNLSSNKLKEVPASLGSLKNLHVLALNRNLLKELPKEIQQLSEENCYHMDIDDNLSDLQPFLQKKGKKNGVKGKQVEDEKKVTKRTKVKLKKVGTSETIGKRPSMEDTITIRLGFNGLDHEDFFAVFDGHAGRKAAVFARENFHLVLAEQLSSELKGDKEGDKKKKKGKEKRRATAPPEVTGDGELVSRCLRNSFLEIDELMKDYRDGATAVVAMVSKRLHMAFVANVGDARAVISRKGKALPLTVDHTPKLASEEQRIRDLNGYITSNRVNGIIAISRSLGDSTLKPLVSAEPGMAVVELQPDDRFLILACDGCWDVIDNQQAVDIVENELQLSNDPVKAAVRLKEIAFWCGSADNISVIVVVLKKYVGRKGKEAEEQKPQHTEEVEKLVVSESVSTRKRGGTDSLYEHMSRGARSMTLSLLQAEEMLKESEKKEKKGKKEKKKRKNSNNSKQHEGGNRKGAEKVRSDSALSSALASEGTESEKKMVEEEMRERRSSSFSEEVLLPRAPGSDAMVSEGGSSSSYGRGRSDSFVDSKEDVPLPLGVTVPVGTEGVLTRERNRHI